MPTDPPARGVRTGGSQARTFLDRARRSQIVDSAIEMIAEVGYANTSLARIAERAGISKGVVLAASSAAGRLRALIEARVGFLATHRVHMQALLDIWISHRDPDGRMVLDSDAAEPNLKAIEELLRNGQETGEFRDFPTRPMAMVISQAIDGVLLQLVNHPDLDLDVFARELVTTFDLATKEEVMTVNTIRRRDVEIAYETFGPASGEPLVLVMGTGGQMLAWHPDFAGHWSTVGFR